MKKDNRKIGLSSLFFHWIQQIINLLPALCVTICIGYIAGIVYRHLSLSSTFEYVNCNIVKDPDCRRSASQEEISVSDSTTSLTDYIEFEDAPKNITVNETWKDPGLLNLKNFKYVMNNESICKPDPKTPKDTIILPVLINSIRDRSSQRDVVRKSWGSLPIYKKFDVRLIFLLGESPESTKIKIDEDDEEADSGDYHQSNNEQLEEEQEKYGDLVMGNFVEHPKNQTYKHMMGYKWILNFCENATFVLNADGDKFLDIIRWLDWRSKDLEILEEEMKKKNDDEDDEEKEKSSVPDLYCDIFTGGKPVREEKSNLYASLEDWPEDTYFDYCAGWAYGITTDLMKKMYSVSNERKFFAIDNVYFGALLHIVKGKFEWSPNINDCYKTYMGQVDKYREICEENGKVNLDKKKDFGPVLVVDEKSFEKDMMCLWNKTLHDSGIKN